jgi:hypothetical protein
MVCFKVLPRHSPGVTEKPRKSPVRIVCARVKIQTAPPEYKSDLLSLESACLCGSIFKALFLLTNFSGPFCHSTT